MIENLWYHHESFLTVKTESEFTTLTLPQALYQLLEVAFAEKEAQLSRVRPLLLYFALNKLPRLLPLLAAPSHFLNDACIPGIAYSINSA